MNKILYTLLSLVLLSSCTDFLDEQSENLLIPTTVSDYEEMFHGEIYRNLGYYYGYIHEFTDDAQDDILMYRSYGRAAAYATWQQEIELGFDGSFKADIAWEGMYGRIMLCNVALSEIGDLKGTQEEKFQLRGAAHFMRAYCYLILVNMYADVYSPNNLNAMGVPLQLDNAPSTKLYTRNIIGEVYAQIESDLLAALDNFKELGGERDIFTPGETAANLLLSRYYLYTGNDDECIRYATACLSRNNSLYDMRTLTRYGEMKFYHTENPEWIFNYGQGGPQRYIKDRIMGFSNSLYDLYDDNDARKKAFFRNSPYSFNRTLCKSYRSQIDLHTNGLRVSEAYLNRAEAYARKGDAENARADVLSVREMRITGDPAAGIDGLDILTVVKEEKRREFCGEYLRWFDMRRWGKPSVTRYLMERQGRAYVRTMKYVLEENDGAYILNIPQGERDVNNLIEVYNRPARDGEPYSEL